MNGEGAAVRALYYATAAGDGLAVTASQWLGRDPETGQARALRPCRALPMDRLVEITAEPRLYGFHGTLKAPDRAAPTAPPSAICSTRSAGFAAGRRAPSRCRALRTRLSCRASCALVPAARRAELQDLADRCVVEFDEFRQPADEAELARRRAAGLSPRQDELLVRWGYPYVLEQWRFHLTLTGRLARRRRTVGDCGDCCASAFARLHRPAVGGAAISASSVSPRRAGPSSCWRASGSAADGG